MIFRDRKTKKVLRTWNISDVYVGDIGIAYRAQFFTDLDCMLMSDAGFGPGAHHAGLAVSV